MKVNSLSKGHVYWHLTVQHKASDLIYQPTAATPFILFGTSRGCSLDMPTVVEWKNRVDCQVVCWVNRGKSGTET